MFDFDTVCFSTLLKARRGRLKSPYGEIQTPAFVTVGTKGTVKGLTSEDLTLVHHLFKQRELLAYRLATIHNLTFIENFFAHLRLLIEVDKL